MTSSKRSVRLLILTICVLSFVATSQAFSPQQLKKKEQRSTCSSKFFRLQCLASNDLRDEYYAHKAARNLVKQTVASGIGGIFVDLKDMWKSMDDVVDDFLCKRMGAGEQFYGKRRYNPSGKYNGVYNGMGRSDLIQIEMARARREELELRQQQRLPNSSEHDIDSF